jgi:hypothetical protein
MRHTAPSNLLFNFPVVHFYVRAERLVKAARRSSTSEGGLYRVCVAEVSGCEGDRPRA